MAKKKSQAKRLPTVQSPDNLTTRADLLDDLRQLISDARQQAAQAVNSALTLTYWKVRIHLEILQQQRAEYASRLCRRCRHNWSSNLATDFKRKAFGE